MHNVLAIGSIESQLRQLSLRSDV